MGMYCNQCQETARGTGCEFGGVCGKSEELADLQDLLIYLMKGISQIIVKGDYHKKINTATAVIETAAGIEAASCSRTATAAASGISQDIINHEILKGLFMTITNANFDEKAIVAQIRKMIELRNGLRNVLFSDVQKTSDAAENQLLKPALHDAAIFEVNTLREIAFKASYVGYDAGEDVDIRSLRQLITFGIKGLAAYLHHASNLGKESVELNAFLHEALAATLDDSLSAGDLTALALKAGEYGVKAMALLDEGNTTRYGNPEITEVELGVRKNPAILISGHDLTDLEQLLEQTKGAGIDVYTHSEMLPAHYYPAFKKYSHFAGNYGNAWWKQDVEFESFRGPILFTTNCIVPPDSASVRARIFTTGASGYPGCSHIEADAEGKKDFSAVIAMAGTLPPPDEIETGTILGGFAHAQVFALADQIVDAVNSGAIKKFFVMAGCDGRMKEREYYTRFAEMLPKDSVILTAGCAKYRYNKLKLGTIGGIPRVLDAGQCNDSYSLALIAMKLKEIFQLNDINELPIVYNIAWYEQKAVIVLLALLSLGVKNIHLGPTLPGFLSPNVAKLLIETFGLAGISTAEKDLEFFLGQ